MFFLGHMGIGSKIVHPWSRGLSYKAVLLGTILPDLIDKPLYYGLSFATGLKGNELGLISGTRTFGHTALFLLVLTSITLFRRSKVLAAISLGVASHLLLDGLGDSFWTYYQPAHEVSVSGVGSALLWPFTGWRFPAYPYKGFGEHLSTFSRPHIVAGEIIGGILLAWDYWKKKHRQTPKNRKKRGSTRKRARAT